jgi:glycosyltransferase involved in cell wall biosynthesis
VEPLISVVVASYNTEPYLAESINSIITQTYENWQIIFVDDCSYDNSIETIKEIVIKNNIIDKVKLFRHAHNYGYGAALYHAIRKSDGEIIAIVDSDDALSKKTALQIMVDTHIKNPDVSMVYSNYESCRGELSKIFRKVTCTTLKPGETVLGPCKGGHYSGSHATISHLKTFKKSFYDKTEEVNPLLQKAVDRDITLKLEEVGPLLHIPDFLYIHRIHPSSISSSFRVKPREEKERIMNMKFKMYQDAYDRRNGIKHA